MNAPEVGAWLWRELGALRGGHHLGAHAGPSGHRPNVGLHPLQSGSCMRCARSAETLRVSVAWGLGGLAPHIGVVRRVALVWVLDAVGPGADLYTPPCF